MTAAALICAGLLAGCAGALVAQDRAPQDAGPATPTPYSSADALLDALETSTRGLRDFQAQVIYDRVDAITEDRERRTGRILLEQDGGEPPRRRFAIVFEQHIDAAGHASPQQQRYAFAEGWLVEFDDARRQAIERQLVPEGKSLDPLRLGEGPLPLPVGQRAHDVRRRFTVSLAPAPDAPLLRRLDGVQGLVLVPRPGAGADEDFQEVRIWYDLRTFAPVGVQARMKGGDLKTVLLREVRVNAGLDEQARAALRTTVPEGWVRDRRPWTPAKP